MSSREIIVLMSTVHQHMVIEDRLEKSGIGFKTVVKPRQLGSDCGMALNVKEENVPDVQAVAMKEHLGIFGIFFREKDVWIKWQNEEA